MDEYFIFELGCSEGREKRRDPGNEIDSIVAVLKNKEVEVVFQLTGKFLRILPPRVLIDHF